MTAVKSEKNEMCGTQGRHIAGGIYGLGFIGAVVYFISHAPSFGAGVLGVLKAFVWPAILVYRLLELVKA